MKNLKEVLAMGGIMEESKEYKDIDNRIHEIVADMKVIAKKGKLEFSDTAKVVYDIAELVVHIIVEDKKIPKEEIGPLVKELCHFIYFSPDALNDPDYKFFPQWLEEPVEHELIDTIVPFIVEAFIRVYDK